MSGNVDKHHRLVPAEALAWAALNAYPVTAFATNFSSNTCTISWNASEKTYLHEEVGLTMEDLYDHEAHQVAAKLAWQFENAGLTAKAVDYLIIAARQAARMGANHELIEHCNRGMDLLLSLPFSPQMVKQGLILQMSMGGGLMATKGYADQETLAAFNRARELCRLAGDAPQLFPVLRGIWAFHFARAEYRTACELGETQLQLSQDQPDGSPYLNARWILGITLFHRGQYTQSLAHLEQVMATYDPVKHSSLTLPNGIDLRVSSWSCSALCLSMLGYPDQASAYSQKGLMLARQLGHPLTLAFALVYASFLRLSHPTASATLEMFEECLTLTADYGFLIYQITETVWHHYLQGMRSGAQEAAEEIRTALTAWQGAGAEFLITDFLCKLAEVCGKAGQVEEAFAYVDEALAYADKNDERYMQPEIYRLQGELLWHQRREEQLAESSFKQAIKLAKKQKARLPELRATITLCQLWVEQDKGEAARTALAEIYGWFSEGFDEPDLLAAKKLLDQLSSPR